MTKKKISLALQGGGAHGAFTWGVLDRLLEDDRLEISAISGTSAGAINAAVLADGFERDGAPGAQQALAQFWRRMGAMSYHNPYRADLFNPLGLPWSPIAAWASWLSGLVSPSQINPFDYNPLRDALAATIDFERVRRCRSIPLYICATNVRSNRLRIFTHEEFSVDVLLASACLPQIYRAVEIDGEFYWDGGYMGNPVLEPLIDHSRDPTDIVVVQVNPVHRHRVPVSAAEIADRVNEISFNSSIMREIRSIANITRMVERGVVTDPRYSCVYLHRIEAEEAMTSLGLQSKLDTSPRLLEQLRELGRERASAWLAEHFHDLGVRTTLHLPGDYPSRA